MFKQLNKEEWQRLLAVTPKEKKEAMKKLARWITWDISTRGYDLEHGPFSRAAMGGSAVEVLSQECYEALFCGEWHWKKDRSLSSMLIEIAKSKMGHIRRDYDNHKCPDMSLTSEQSFRKQVEMDIAGNWERESNLRDMGYDIARTIVKNHPQLLAYLDALYRYNDYSAIAKSMGVSVKKVMELEKQLLDMLDKG
jgi:DNA-directed RNA polymerase specialized sigma24 family protein